MLTRAAPNAGGDGLGIAKHLSQPLPREPASEQAARRRDRDAPAGGAVTARNLLRTPQHHSRWRLGGANPRRSPGPEQARRPQPADELLGQSPLPLDGRTQLTGERGQLLGRATESIAGLNSSGGKFGHTRSPVQSANWFISFTGLASAVKHPQPPVSRAVARRGRRVGT